MASNISPFAQAGPLLLARGYCPLTIAPTDAGIKNAGKVPAEYRAKHWFPRKNWNEFHKRYPTEQEMTSFCTYPNAGVGVTLGPLSRIVALDFDWDINGIHTMIRDWVPESPVIKAGAKGFTAFYYYTDNKGGSWNLNGQTVIEILSAGRQTVVPPSVHPNGMDYRWLSNKALWNVIPEDLPCIPDDFHERLHDLFKRLKGESDTQVSIAVSKPHHGQTSNGSATFAKTSFEKTRKALKFIDPDGYWDWLHTGMSLKDYYGEDGYDLWIEWSQGSPKAFDGKQKAITKWKSFRRTGRTIASVFHQAMANGFKNIPEFNGEQQSWGDGHELPPEAMDIVIPAYLPIKADNHFLQTKKI